MQYELKAKKGVAVFALLISIALVVCCVLNTLSQIRSGDSAEAFFAILITAFGVYFFLHSLNDLTKCLSFNDVNFTLNDETYTYGQIEKIDIRSSRYGRIFYSICVDGSNIYTFTKSYIGADKFLHFLNAHNVPGTPRE